MLIRHTLCAVLCVSAFSTTWAVRTPAPATATPATATPAAATPLPAKPTQAPLVEPKTAAISDLPAAITAIQQKHKLELAQQEKRLALLEQANQTALAQNQSLQLKNDNLNVQVQVLQSERSAQMFIYGAVTFGCGVFAGVLIYSILYSRRRRQW